MSHFSKKCWFLLLEKVWKCCFYALLADLARKYKCSNPCFYEYFHMYLFVSLLSQNEFIRRSAVLIYAPLYLFINSLSNTKKPGSYNPPFIYLLVNSSKHISLQETVLSMRIQYYVQLIFLLIL